MQHRPDSRHQSRHERVDYRHGSCAARQRDKKVLDRFAQNGGRNTTRRLKTSKCRRLQSNLPVGLLRARTSDELCGEDRLNYTARGGRLFLQFDSAASTIARRVGELSPFRIVGRNLGLSTARSRARARLQLVDAQPQRVRAEHRAHVARLSVAWVESRRSSRRSPQQSPPIIDCLQWRQTRSIAAGRSTRPPAIVCSLQSTRILSICKVRW